METMESFEAIQAIQNMDSIDEKSQVDSDENEDEPSRPPHPATRSMRSLSPYVVKNPLHKKSYCRYMYLGSDIGKIHRIFLSSEVAVEVVNVLSPSCIWVRLFTHRVEDCIIKLENQKHFLEPLIKYNLSTGKVKKSSKAILHNYYMAPRFYNSENEGKSLMYARVRLLQIEEKETPKGPNFYKCLVFYIDYGDSNWVYMDSLANVPKNMLNIPWQVTPVSLLGVSPPTECQDEYGSIIWSREHCKILRKLLPKYHRFNAVPAISKKFGFWNYEDYARVDLHALIEDISTLDQASETGKETNKTDYNAPESVTVASQFCVQCAIEEVEVIYDLELTEASQTLLYGVNEKEEFDSNAKNRKTPIEFCDFHYEFSKEVATDEASDEIIEALKKKIAAVPSSFDARNPTQIDKEEDMELLEELIVKNLEKWDPQLKEKKTATYPVKLISMKHLKAQEVYNKSTNAVAIAIIDFEECITSPYEFYGHFVKASSSAKKLYKYILKFQEEFSEWQRQLNIFYYLRSNWKRLDKDEISSAYSKGEKVFGIYGSVNEQSEINMYRVQVIAFSGKEHIIIRFLDRGGSMMINNRTLIRLNSKHASKPPMAAHFCLHNISPNSVGKSENNSIWTKKQCKYFQECIRTDTPMICQLDKIHNHNKQISSYVLGMPHELVEVFYVSNLYPGDPEAPNSNTTVEALMIKNGSAVNEHCSKFEPEYPYC